MAYTLQELGMNMNHYIEQICAGITLKGLVSAVPALLSTYYGADIYLFKSWFVLNVVDLVFGIWLALKTIDPETGKNKFSRRRLYGWVLKSFVQMGSIVLAGVITVSAERLGTEGIAILGAIFGETLFINWVLFLLLITEAASVVDSSEKLGLPVNPAIKACVKRFRKMTEEKFKD